MPKVQVARWGNSLAVRIPKAVAEEARLQEGDAIVIEASGDGIELRRAEQVPTLEQLVAQIKPQNRCGEISSGRARGKEAIEW